MKPNALLFPGRGPRVFGVPPGLDFVDQLAAGLAARIASLAPDAVARVTVLVPTSRMARRLTLDLAHRSPGLQPRVRLIDSLLNEPAFADLPVLASPLHRRLELGQLVAGWLNTRGAPPASQIWDLTDSLLDLLDAMQAQNVTPTDLRNLDVSDASGHWQQALTFLTIAAPWFDGADAPGHPARLRQIVAALDATWRRGPVDGPLIVAGTTGSRLAVHDLLRAVARRPDGAVVLPGFDIDLPPAAWSTLAEALTCEDHPQFRVARLLDPLGLAASDVEPWHDRAAPVPSRAAFVSLALRPPPLTEQWLTEAPRLAHLRDACAGVTWLEAPSPGEEADAIALRMRVAIEDGQRAALVTPDRSLARRVAAALGRWNVHPDDSAGEPLSLAPPGRLLRLLAHARHQPVQQIDLLTILKHPLVHSAAGRARHLDHVRRMELALRANPQLDAHALPQELPGVPATWLTWVRAVVAPLTDAAAVREPLPLADQLESLRNHIDLAVAGSWAIATATPLAVWDDRSGRALRVILDRLVAESGAAGRLAARDMAVLLDHVLGREIAREDEPGHPLAVIRGLQEWRADRADLVILGGLNDGGWPARAEPDPWLNRQMRDALGLPLPERELGVSAHDFQNAVNRPEVWLTRAVRANDAPQTASRWLTRMESLLLGLQVIGAGGTASGREILTEMKQRGEGWLDRARRLAQAEAAIPPAPRPSPVPPVLARPRRLRVTDLETLRRDPYSVYARLVLQLHPIDPLTPDPDLRVRGQVLHRAVEVLGTPGFDPTVAHALQAFEEACAVTLDAAPIPPLQRRLWQGRLRQIAPVLIAEERERRAAARPFAVELTGETTVGNTRIVGRLDRVDIDDQGRAWLYDYKAGAVPSGPEQAVQRQLHVLAGMVERGAFPELGPRPVAHAAYLTLSPSGTNRPAAFDKHSIAETMAELETILASWTGLARGYTARSLPPKGQVRVGDYDHVARLGEWDETSHPVRLEVG